MWAKRINDLFESMSEYDNPALSLHMARDFLEIVKGRVEVTVDDAIAIKLMAQGDKPEEEVDEEGFLYWLQFTFHKELVAEILSLRESFTKQQNQLNKLSSEVKSVQDNKEKVDKTVQIEKTKHELDKIKLLMSRVEGYRRSTFTQVKDLDGAENLIQMIRIYKERVV